MFKAMVCVSVVLFLAATGLFVVDRVEAECTSETRVAAWAFDDDCVEADDEDSFTANLSLQ